MAKKTKSAASPRGGRPRAKKTAPKKSVAAKRSTPKRAAVARPAKRPAQKAKKAEKKAPPPKAAVEARAPAKKARAAKAKKPSVSSRKAPVARAAKRGAAASKAVRRRDGAGHIDPAYARDLLEKGGGPADEGKGFLGRPRSKDDLVEELGEEFVEEATSAEHEGEDVLDQEVPEDRGGPFVETSGEEEFGYGTDPSNPKGAKREPFPTT